MSMIKKSLSLQLEAYFKNNDKTNKEAADELAAIIDGYIRTASVSTAVTGTSATGGPVVGQGVGGLA